MNNMMKSIDTQIYGDRKANIFDYEHLILEQRSNNLAKFMDGKEFNSTTSTLHNDQRYVVLHKRHQYQHQIKKQEDLIKTNLIKNTPDYNQELLRRLNIDRKNVAEMLMSASNDIEYFTKVLRDLNDSIDIYETKLHQLI